MLVLLKILHTKLMNPMPAIFENCTIASVLFLQKE